MEEYYRCFSGKLKKFLIDNKNNYILKANDCLTGKTFWLFKKDKKLDKYLMLWSASKNK